MSETMTAQVRSMSACHDCGIEFEQNSRNNRRYCSECRVLRDAEAANRHAKAWAARNPEKVK